MLPYANSVDKNPAVEEEEEPYDYEQAKVVNWYDRLLLNRPAKVITVLILAAIVAPLLIYHYVFFNTLDLPPADGYSIGSCLLSRSARLPCGHGYMNETDCHPQCCFDLTNNICFHRFPSRFTYISNVFWDEEVNLRPRVATVPFKNQNSVPIMRLSFDEVSPTHISITFFDPSNDEVPEARRMENKEYIHDVSIPELNVMVNRTAEQTIFNTFRGPIIASDNIWEIAFRLTEEKMYGLGEIPLKEGTVKVIYNNEDNSLSSIPLIFAKSNGSYHGLFIDVEDPTEIKIEVDNQIVLRSITRKGIKFHVFTGPQPRDIMADVMKLIGFNMKLEYWMLGAHICSDVTDTNEDALNDLAEFFNEAARDNLPFESHCGARPVLFTDDYCEEENDYVQKSQTLVKDAGKRYVPHLSPYIRHEIEEEFDYTTTEDDLSTTETTTDYIPTTTTEPKCSVFYEYNDHFLTIEYTNRVYSGKVGTYDVIYPDYRVINESVTKKLLNPDVKLDGIVFENNWPLDESFKNHNVTYEVLPYFSEDLKTAFDSTPEWYIVDSNLEKHLYSHNAYGDNFVKAFKNTYNDIPLWSTIRELPSRKTESFVNRQNVDASWTNLQNELVEAALGGISGYWLWSSPICGDTENYSATTQTSLCVKWYMASTYFPMIKVHSRKHLRHPLSFVGTNKIYIANALNQRLSLLPYFYTTLQTGPLLRPMFYQFPDSESIHDLKNQFSVGDSLLIAPNLQPSQTHVHIRIPPGTWYELWSGLPIDGEEGEPVTMTTTEADFLAFIRGGSIVVMQKDVEVTAEETRRLSDYSLTVALECETTYITDHTGTQSFTNCTAQGSLYVNKNLTIKFAADADVLNLTADGVIFEPMCIEDSPTWSNRLKDISVYGLEDKHNNYDYHRYMTVNVNLCDLEQAGNMSISLV